MIEATLDNGKILMIPSSVEEITFEDYCDFRANEEKYLASNAPGDNRIDPDLTIDYLLDALSYMVKGEIRDITELGTSKDTIDDFTIFGIYNYVIAIVNNYEPTELPIDFGFVWKKKWYMLDSQAVTTLFTGIQPTTVEAITLLEFGRFFDVKKRQGLDNTEFNFGLEHLAVLCRLPGENLPVRREERIKFIDARKNLFAKVPMNIPLDLRFFLAIMLRKLSNTAFTKISGKNKKKVLKALNRPNSKPRPKQKPRLRRL